MGTHPLLVRIVGGAVGAACGVGPLIAVDQAGRAQLISEHDYVFLSIWLWPGIPIAALAGGLAGAMWARSAWRSDSVDWWQAGAVSATAFGIGLVMAGLWGCTYRLDLNVAIETRMVVAAVVIFFALPMVTVAFIAALAWLALMHLAAKGIESAN